MLFSQNGTSCIVIALQSARLCDFALRSLLLDLSICTNLGRMTDYGEHTRETCMDGDALISAIWQLMLLI